MLIVGLVILAIILAYSIFSEMFEKKNERNCENCAYFAECASTGQQKCRK